MEEQLAKYFSGESNQDEIEKIKSWRAASSDNAKAFLEAKNLWLDIEKKPEPNEAILEKILSNETRTTKKSEAKVVQMPFGWWKYAAAAVVIIGLVFAWILTRVESDLVVEQLADGSKIFLHGESTISSIEYTEGMRQVQLKGKAYFDVERDEKRPFVVLTENARVEVLGTSFVIDSYDKKTEVCVETGQVALIKPGGNGRTDLSVKLSKGEMGTVTNTNKGILKRNNNDPNYLSWKTKTLVFKRSKMSEVEMILEDVYNIDVEFENPNLRDCNLTAQFKERRAKDAIEIIARTFNLDYEIEGKKVILSGKGC